MGNVMPEVNINDLTPLMKQYLEVKNEYKDCILFYRLGDFYEMFFEDAITASKELEITLTGKNCGLEERAPMCGIPYHASEGYLTKLVEKGYRVAICEQVEDPKTAKGLVRREVIRIVTPGTNLNPQALDESRNNYLMCIVYGENISGIAAVDVTTGDFYVTEAESVSKIYNEIYKYMPSELICNASYMISGADTDAIKQRLGISLRSMNEEYFEEFSCEEILTKHFNNSVTELGLSDYPYGRIAAGGVLKYLIETQKNPLEHLTRITPYINSKYMIVDNSTRRNLELCETLRDKNKRGSLLWVLDKTKTAMGARMLRSFIEHPLLEKEEIEKRLDAVDELKNNIITREELREYLNSIYDLERLIGRISYRSANPRDLIAFLSSVEMLPPIKTLLSDFESSGIRTIFEELDVLDDLKQLIASSINEEPPINVREGGIIKEGYNAEVDELRSAKTEGKSWLAEMEARERENTGIKNLRIKFNRVFGYYLEVTNSYKELVPENWIRKQTLTGAERYTTPELKELEDKILHAEDRLYSLEYDLFCYVRDRIASEVNRIQKTAKLIATLDAFASLAYVAERNNYCRPFLNNDGVLDIRNGRHPVVELMQGENEFIANDTYLDNDKSRISIITGPNMAGKSTYMRQTALIVFMAQIGSFVPAEHADVGIVDRVFTRVGASDDLASGQSTFMVEMNEVAEILKNATSNSLLILDEIGRGTSTFDGLSIAWAVVEHISNEKLLGAKTLFATHYHELTELEGKLDSVNNFCIAVKEQGDDIVFLRKIIKGGADKSYGIQVARLAGLPESVLKRAKEIVTVLSDNDIGTKAKASLIELHEQAADFAKSESAVFMKSHKRKSELEMNQLSLFGTSEYDRILEEIRNTDLSALTPIDALNRLYSLQERVKNII